MKDIINKKKLNLIQTISVKNFLYNIAYIEDIFYFSSVIFNNKKSLNPWYNKTIFDFLFS